MAWSATSDVQARVAGRTFGATTSPTTTQVSQWLTEAEALLTGVLNAVSISVPDTSEILKSWAVDYAEGHLRMAWSGPPADENNEGQVLIDRFYARLKEISESPGFYDAMINGSGGESSRITRGYVLDNDDDKTIADGDFDPTFDEDTEW